jgi:polysaccharide pyruvyl transferase WcaK-like protein
MTKAWRQIGIFGDFGGGNLGNEGSLEAMIDFLRQVRPDAELICLCHNPAAVAGRYGIAARPYRAPRLQISSRFGKAKARLLDAYLAIRGVRGMDVLIIPGTGALDDFCERPYGLPLTIFLVCLVARLRRIRIYFVSIGAGPIQNWLSRWLMKSAAALGHYRSYRDVPSRLFIKELGIDVGRDEIYPDIAFKLKAPQVDKDHEQNQPIRIGVGMMAYRGWRNDAIDGNNTYAVYHEKMVNLVLWLLDSGYHVRVIIGDTVDCYAVSDLSHRIRCSRNELANGRFVVQPSSSLYELMSQIVETDMVIGTRFHNIVCALKVGRPVISLGYSAKFEALMKEAGLEQFCQSVETFDIELLKSQVRELIRNSEVYERRIRHAVIAFEDRLKRQDHILASDLLDGRVALYGVLPKEASCGK